MTPPHRPANHLATAQRILNQQPDDIGDHDVARATAHAVTAAAEQLTEIASLLRQREQHTGGPL